MTLVLMSFRSKLDYLPWYDFKKETREYLAEINKDKKVIQYLPVLLYTRD
jgi:hypothetical protein